MKPSVLSQLPKEDVKLFNNIETVVEQFDDVDLGKNGDGIAIVLSSHIFARAFAKVFKLEFQDGYFHPFHIHSWLLTPHGNIIDVYPVEMLGGPILVYQRGNFSPPIKFQTLIEMEQKLWFFNAVETTERQVRQIAKSKFLLK